MNAICGNGYHFIADGQTECACKLTVAGVCATCGHPLATHDEGPSEDGCRFMFGWGRECECGWPVRAKLAAEERGRSSEVERQPEALRVGGSTPSVPTISDQDQEAIALAVRNIRFWLVQSFRYTASTLELEEVLTRELTALMKKESVR